MQVYIGIDPGLSGGIAVVGEDGTPVDIMVMPTVPLKSKRGLDLPRILSVLKAWKNNTTMILLEKQQVMPAQGAVSGFTIGLGYGVLIGMVTALQIPHDEVAPASWKKAMGIIVGKDTADRKALSVAKARALFPLVDLVATSRSTKYHDGMAEALLLAELCRRRCHGITEGVK